MLTVDLIFPIAVFIFFLLLARYTSGRLALGRRTGRALVALPFAYVALDLLENVLIFIILSIYPDRLELLASLIGYVTTAKRIAMLGALLIPLALLAISRLSGRARQDRGEVYKLLGQLDLVLDQVQGRGMQ